MAKNSYKANVNQYANQEEAIRKAKGNPNKNIHSKKKNSNYGGYTTGAYMAQKVADYAYVLETGTLTLSGTGAELLTNEQVKAAYLGKKRVDRT